MHMVTYRLADGSAAYHQADSLEDAARFVEHLTNEGRGTEARIYSMTEVPIAVKTYYKVEIAAPAPAPAPAAPAAAAPEPEPVLAGASNGDGGGRFGLFSKS